MLPEIASLKERMALGGNWHKFREEIAELHRKAKTQEEFSALLEAHAILGALIDEVMDEDTAKKIHPVHASEYRLFLMMEAGGDSLNPAIFDAVTAREVAAGRMAPDDDFRELASAAGEVMGDTSYLTAKPSRPGNLLALGIAVIAITLWAASVRPLGFSALWLIALGIAGGTFLNAREKGQIRRDAEVERARRGY